MKDLYWRLAREKNLWRNEKEVGRNISEIK
jgi:hypothetical protein